MKKKTYVGAITANYNQEIYLNVSYLDKGVYQLKIVDEHKIVSQAQFEKK